MDLCPSCGSIFEPWPNEGVVGRGFYRTGHGANGDHGRKEERSAGEIRRLIAASRLTVTPTENASDFAMVTVTSAHVAAVPPLWRKDAGNDWRQLVEPLRLHYPEAADLLHPSLLNDALDQWIAADAVTGDAAEDLYKLGLVERANGNSWGANAST